MAEFFLELFSEEIPAGLQKNLREKLLEEFQKFFLEKSIKSKTELKNTIKSHVFDGAALTKFLFWLKKNYKKKNLDEIKAQKKLFKFRKENKSFK